MKGSRSPSGSLARPSDTPRHRWPQAAGGIIILVNGPAAGKTELLRDAYPERPEMGVALSRALLEAVAGGRIPDTIRLSRPGRVVAFGRRDTVSPGYPDAVRAARAAGYEAMERLAGGRAAIYFEGALSLTVTVRDPEPARRTRARFERVSAMLREAIAGFGIDARVGEVEGEYCPGAYSINSAGRVKLAGVGQRMIRGAAHTGVVIVVSSSAEVRRVLEPVYAALGLSWRPETAGAIAEEVPAAAPAGTVAGGSRGDGVIAGDSGSSGPGRAAGAASAAWPPGLAEVEAALLAELTRERDLEPAELDAAVAARAEELGDRFRSPKPTGTAQP